MLVRITLMCVFLFQRDYITLTHSPGSELLKKLDALSITIEF